MEPTGQWNVEESRVVLSEIRLVDVESWSGKAASYRRWRNCSPRHSLSVGPATRGARVSVDRSAALAPGDSIQEDSLLLQSPRLAYAAIFTFQGAATLGLGAMNFLGPTCSGTKMNFFYCYSFAVFYEVHFD
ncbi:hypothetical protein ABZP36_007819 [Zizania latifolia]